MNILNKLTLPEKVLLLVLHDKKGTFQSGYYYYGIGGAILAELFLKEKIELDQETNNIKILNNEPLNDDVLEECLKMIKESKKDQTATHWLSKFSSLRKLTEKIAQSLCRNQVLREDESKILFFFTQKRYPEINPDPENELIAKLEDALFSNTNNPDPEIIILIAICYHTQILHHSFDSKRIKKNKEHIENLIDTSLVGNALNKVIAEYIAIILQTIIISNSMNHQIMFNN